MTNIGDIITGAIPGDVTEFADRDTLGTQWGRWVFNPASGNFGWCNGEAGAERRRSGDPDHADGTPPHRFIDGMNHLRPFRVLVVRPQVVEVPTAPDGWTRVQTRVGTRFSLRTDESGGKWVQIGGGAQRTWPHLLAEFGPLENITPREPRVWSKLDAEAAPDDLQVVEVEGHGRWRRWSETSSSDGQALFARGASKVTLARLRTLGEVREVVGE